MEMCGTKKLDYCFVSLPKNFYSVFNYATENDEKEQLKIKTKKLTQYAIHTRRIFKKI